MDYSVVLWLNGFAGHHPVLDDLMLGLSRDAIPGAVLSGLLLLLYRPERRTALQVLLAMALGGLAETVLKVIIGRPRPYTWLPVHVLGPLPTDFSYPSGHATVAFAAAMALWLRSRGAGAAALLVAAAIAVSRIYLGVHYPSDVLGGAAIGAIVAEWVTYTLNRK